MVIKHSALGSFEIFGRKLSVLLVIVSVGLLLALPVLFYGLSYSHSVSYNLSWYTGFSEQLFAGDFYPRWIDHPNDQLGSPAFYFYPPLFFYFASLVDLLTGFSLSALYVVGWTAALLLPLSGLSMYQLLHNNRQIGRAPAVLGAIFYMAAPYHLEIDLFVRSALGEYLSYLWLPLVFLSTQWIVEGKKHGPGLMALTYGALVVSHIPTALLMVPFVAALALWQAVGLQTSTKTKLIRIAGVGLSAGLGCGMVGVYLLPALLTQDYITPQILWSDYFSFDNWYLTSVSSWPDRSIMVRITMLAVIYGASALYFIYRHRTDNQRQFGGLMIWAFMALTVLLLMTGLTAPLWDSAPVFKKVQFPWRLMSILELSVTVLMAGLLTSWMKGKQTALSPSPLWITVLVIVLIPSVIAIYARSTAYWHKPAITKKMDVELARGKDPEEFRTKWTPKAFKTRWFPTYRNMSNIGIDKDTLAVLEEGGVLKAERTNKREYKLSGRAVMDTRIIIRKYYYPIWQATNSAGQMITPKPTRNGLLSVPVAKGQFSISVFRQRLKEEKTGALVSLVSVCLLLLLVFFNSFRGVVLRH